MASHHDWRMRSEFRAAGPVHSGLNIVICGDSIGAGYELLPGQDPTAQAANYLATLGFACTVHNVAIPGTVSSSGVAEYAGTIAPLYNAAIPKNVLIIEYGTNDLYQQLGEASTLRPHQQSLVSSGRATGFKCVVWCPGHDWNVATPGTYETDVTANNNYWLGQIGTGADAVCSWYLDSLFSSMGAAGWFSSGDVHPSAVGANKIGVTYLAPAILHAIGAA
jgi:lysophospholipase L1-like esterase